MAAVTFKRAHWHLSVVGTKHFPSGFGTNFRSHDDVPAK